MWAKVKSDKRKSKKIHFLLDDMPMCGYQPEGIITYKYYVNIRPRQEALCKTCQHIVETYRLHEWETTRWDKDLNY